MPHKFPKYFLIVTLVEKCLLRIPIDKKKSIFMQPLESPINPLTVAHEIQKFSLNLFSQGKWRWFSISTCWQDDILSPFVQLVVVSFCTSLEFMFLTITVNSAKTWIFKTLLFSSAVLRVVLCFSDFSDLHWENLLL